MSIFTAYKSFVFSSSIVIFGTLPLVSCKLHDPRDEVPRAECGPGSSPETGLQGQVPLVDRQNGRSQQGYSCNMKLISQYQGTGNATLGAKYQHCMYSGSMGVGSLQTVNSGIQVVDFSDLDNPQLTKRLDSTAARIGSWETLKVHKKRGLMAMASVPLVYGGGYLSLYDVSDDCSNPRLLNGLLGSNETLPMLFLSHEANFSPDGKTYWSTGVVPGSLTAFDVSNPRWPRIVFQGLTGLSNHGLNFLDDGNTMFVSTMFPAGVEIFDVSDIQKRRWFPRMRKVGSLHWDDGLVTQFIIPFESDGHQYLLAMDEFGSGGVRLINIDDLTKPALVRKYELEINRPEMVEIRKVDVTGNGVFGYEAHYCSIDKNIDPQWLACTFVQSGIRVFDISDVMQPKEIAYYNPPAVPKQSRGQLLNSAHAMIPIATPFSDLFNGNIGKAGLQIQYANMSTDWCMSRPEFVGNQIWVHCDDNGAMVLEFTNGVGPSALK